MSVQKSDEIPISRDIRQDDSFSFFSNPRSNRVLPGPGSGCGAYGYDINQLCSAWREAPEEMTKEQYQVEQPGHILSQDQHSDLLRNGS